MLRTDSDNPDFRQLVALLDRYLGEMDGEEHSFYAQYNKLDKIHHVVVAYRDGIAAGCGAIKAYSDNIAEVKRMYVHPEYRQQGIASHVLSELESWAGELKFDTCILETGKRQEEAIGLYRKMDYKVIENYGQYNGVENSVCMQKSLNI